MILEEELISEIRKAEETGKEYLSLYKRPKYSSQCILNEGISKVRELTAIVIQGPIVTEDNFTLETVKLYSKLYPGTYIIVSTWDNEDPQFIFELENKENCCVILNQYPEHSGLLNMNYQIRTTLAGINKAKEMKKKYIFKTRTDFRFYRKGIIDWMASLIELFPMGGDIVYQKGRIIAGSCLGGSMFRPFWLADQFNFGLIEDMINYWNYPYASFDLDKKTVQEIFCKEHLTWTERTQKHLAAEPEILRNYFYRMENSIPECTVKEYWKIVKRQFVVVSRHELGFYWYKYLSKYDECACSGQYYSEDTEQKYLSYTWDFVQWLLLYQGVLSYEERYEEFSNKNRY